MAEQTTFINFIKNIHKYTYNSIKNFIDNVIKDNIEITDIINLDISDSCILKRQIFVTYLLKKKGYLIMNTNFLGGMIHIINFNDRKELYMISQIFELYNYVTINNCRKISRIPVNIEELEKRTTYDWNNMIECTLAQFKYLQEYIYADTISLTDLKKLERLRKFAVEIKYDNFIKKLNTMINTPNANVINSFSYFIFPT